MPSDPIFRTEGITIVDISGLNPHPKNPNKHTPEQVKRLAEILKYQGVRRPVTVSKLSGFMTVGHGMVMAAKHLGWKHMPVSFQDYDDEDAEYAHMVSDNAIGSWSDLNLSEINIELQNLGPSFDIDMLGLKGFTLDPSGKAEVSFEAKTGAKELNESDFQQFDHACPKCGFGFDE